MASDNQNILQTSHQNTFNKELKNLVENLSYSNPEETISHIKQALYKYDNLGVTSDTYTDRSVKFKPIKLIKLTGSFSVPHQNNLEYQIPIECFIPTIFPSWPPVCFVRPTEDMAFVENHTNCRMTDGKICTRYITAWAKRRGEDVKKQVKQSPTTGYCLIKLFDDLVKIFSEKIPVVNKPKIERPPSYQEIFSDGLMMEDEKESNKENRYRSTTCCKICQCSKNQSDDNEEDDDDDEELPSYEESNRLKIIEKLSSCGVK